MLQDVERCMSPAKRPGLKPAKRFQLKEARDFVIEQLEHARRAETRQACPEPRRNRAFRKLKVIEIQT